MLALLGMDKRRWSEHHARPALSIPGPRANAGHDHSLAFYLAADETAIASEATAVILVAQPKRLMFFGDKSGQPRFRPDLETLAPGRMSFCPDAKPRPLQLSWPSQTLALRGQHGYGQPRPARPCCALMLSIRMRC